MIKIIPAVKGNDAVTLEDNEYNEILEKPDGYVITECKKVLPAQFRSTPLGGYFIRDNLVEEIVEV